MVSVALLSARLRKHEGALYSQNAAARRGYQNAIDVNRSEVCTLRKAQGKPLGWAAVIYHTIATASTTLITAQQIALPRSPANQNPHSYLLRNIGRHVVFHLQQVADDLESTRGLGVGDVHALIGGVGREVSGRSEIDARD